MRRIRMGILDSSPLAAQLLSCIVQEDTRFLVAGVYSSYTACRANLRNDRVDVLVADISDEKGEPLTLIRDLDVGGRGPIFLLLADQEWLTESTLASLRGAGMTNHILRPPNVFELERIGRQILTNALAAFMIRRVKNPDAEREAEPDAVETPGPAAPGSSLRSLVLAYGGKGGMAALEKVVPLMKRGPARILVAVVHDESVAVSDRLCRLCEGSGTPLIRATEGEKLAFGRVYIARSRPEDLRLIVDRNTRSAFLGFETSDTTIGAYTPSFDRLATDAATVFGKNLSGLALSGSVPHGLAGLKAIVERGGSTFGLSPEALSMPALVKEGSRIGAVQRVVSPDGLEELFSGSTSTAPVTHR